MASQAEIRNVANELDTDPTGINYSADNQTAADQMNDRTLGDVSDRDVFSGQEIFAMTDRNDWRMLLAAAEQADAAGTVAQAQVRAWHEMTLLNVAQSIDITVGNYLETTRYCFGPASATETALLAARPQNISRAERLANGDKTTDPPTEPIPYPVPVLEGHIADARKLLTQTVKR